MKVLACVVGSLLLTSLPAYAQGVGSSGEITGTVTDSAGGLLLKATVTVVDVQTGLKRTVTMNSTGQFRVVGLLPATYDVSAEMAGFGRDRADGHLRFQTESVKGCDGGRGHGPAAGGGN
jgi:hypothetical protein